MFYYHKTKLLESVLLNRGKYSRRSLVVADFSPIDADYTVDRLYTFTLLSLGIMSFLILSYAFLSGLQNII